MEFTWSVGGVYPDLGGLHQDFRDTIQNFIQESDGRTNQDTCAKLHYILQSFISLNINKHHHYHHSHHHLLLVVFLP